MKVTNKREKKDAAYQNAQRNDNNARQQALSILMVNDPPVPISIARMAVARAAPRHDELLRLPHVSALAAAGMWRARIMACAP